MKNKSMVAVFLLLAAAIVSSQEAYGLVGGNKDVRNEFPSSVKIVLGQDVRCSAVKIGKTTYLSAAHCFQGYGTKTEINDEFYQKYFGPDIMKIIKDKPILTVRIISHGSEFDTVPTIVYRHSSFLKSINENDYTPFSGPVLSSDEILKRGGESGTAILSGKVLDLAILEVKDENPISIAKLSFHKMDDGKLVFSGGYGNSESQKFEDIVTPSYGTVSAFTSAESPNLLFLTAHTADKLGSKEIPPVLQESGDSGGALYSYDRNVSARVVVGINSLGDSEQPNEDDLSAIDIRLDVAKSWICEIVKLDECKGPE